MKNIIEIKNLNFKYGAQVIFDDLSLAIKDGTYLTVVGSNGSGKSTLVRLLLGLYKVDGHIVFNNTEMSYQTIKEIVKNIGVVFENPDDQFVASIVMDDIAFTLENLNEEQKDIYDKVVKVAKTLGIEHLLEAEPQNLSGGEKQLVALASALVHEPKVLILDEAFTMLDGVLKEKVYSLLKTLNKEQGVTIINVTHDMDEVLYGSEILVLDKGKVVLYGGNKDVLKEEKVFTKLGLKLPFMAELSIKLQYYNLIDDMIFSLDEMVNTIWK